MSSTVTRKRPFVDSCISLSAIREGKVMDSVLRYLYQIDKRPPLPATLHAPSKVARTFIRFKMSPFLTLIRSETHVFCLIYYKNPL